MEDYTSIFSQLRLDVVSSGRDTDTKCDCIKLIHFFKVISLYRAVQGVPETAGFHLNAK